MLIVIEVSIVGLFNNKFIVGYKLLKLKILKKTKLALRMVRLALWFVIETPKYSNLEKGEFR
jgi:hypothetical protein